MEGSCWLLCWRMLYISHNQLSTWLSVESAQVWRWLPLGCWSQQLNPFPHRSCPPPAIPPIQTSPLSPSAASTASEPNACAGSVKNPLDPSVQLHHCKTQLQSIWKQVRFYSPRQTWARSLYPHDTAVTLPTIWQREALLQRSLSSQRQILSGGRQHGHLQQLMHITSWLHGLERAPSQLKWPYTQLRTPPSLLWTPGFSSKCLI